MQLLGGSLAEMITPPLPAGFTAINFVNTFMQADKVVTSRSLALA
jgi:hypothetical protein